MLKLKKIRKTENQKTWGKLFFFMIVIDLLGNRIDYISVETLAGMVGSGCEARNVGRQRLGDVLGLFLREHVNN